MDEYIKQASDFLEKTGTVFTAEFLKYDFHFTGDKEKRDIYKITLKRGNRAYSFNFGQSLNSSGLRVISPTGKTLFVMSTNDYLKIKNSEFPPLKFTIKQRYFVNLMPADKITKPETPTAYDVLACLQKYPIDTFEDFCSEFGYDEDSRAAEKTYKAVKTEYENLSRLFSDEELEEMQEIN